MELRHLRCFVAVAEELHFARAAERLHIEQSPLSRAIKELEEDLGTRLFIRTTRNTRLSRAGQMFLEHVPRIFTALQQARKSVKAVAAGYDGQLRVALSDGITPPRLSALLMQCREDDPEVDIHLVEVPLSQQIKGLHDDLYDVGFAQPDEVSDGLLAGLSPRPRQHSCGLAPLDGTVPRSGACRANPMCRPALRAPGCRALLSRLPRRPPSAARALGLCRLRASYSLDMGNSQPRAWHGACAFPLQPPCFAHGHVRKTRWNLCRSDARRNAGRMQWRVHLHCTHSP